MPAPAARAPHQAAPARTPPLWRQLQAAARLVADVRAGESLSTQLPQVDEALRPGAQALSFHTLRWLGLATHLRAQLARRPPPAQADALLCTALALMAQPGPQPYTAFTLVSQTVEAAKRHPRLRSQAGLLNACLRRYLREADALLATVTEASATAFWNHPDWWVQQLQHDHPQHWRALLHAAQARPAMVLRVNTQRTTVSDFLTRLTQAGLPAHALGGAAVQLAQPCPVSRIPGFAQGLASVQSASAQWAAPLLLQELASPAPRVLDACAAPGGKTAHLLELCPQAQVTALEMDAERARRIHDNLQRLGLQAQVRVADAARTGDWWDGQPFDAILLDAPCSASGIVSRHPDVRWLRRPGDLVQLAAQQDRLLHALWPLLRPGGRLLYCTCSVFASEGRERIDNFLQTRRDAHPLPAPGHLLPAPTDSAAPLGDNPPCDDAFYYALLQKPVA